MRTNTTSSKESLGYPVLTFLVMFAGILGVFFLPYVNKAFTEPKNAQLTYIISIIVMLVAFVLAGLACGRNWKGILIDEYNRISLSRLQACLWSLAVFPAIATAVAWNLSVERDKAFAITIPSQVWMLVGISATTLVAAGIIKQDKATQADMPSKEWEAPAVTQAREALAALEEALKNATDTTRGALTKARDEAQKKLDDALAASPSWTKAGNLACRKDWRQANFIDLFVSDTNPTNSETPPLDFNRVQQLYLSVLTSVGYGAILFSTFGVLKVVAPAMVPYPKFPDFSPEALVLVVISHGSYLVGKATADPGKPDPNPTPGT